jgi:hypothetical protein
MYSHPEQKFKKRRKEKEKSQTERKHLQKKKIEYLIKDYSIQYTKNA